MLHAGVAMAGTMAGVVLMMGGVLLLVRGLRQCGRAFPHPWSASMQPLMWMQGFRRAVAGFALVAIGAGLWRQAPVLIALGVAIGLEETIESSLAIWGLRSGARIGGKPSAIPDTALVTTDPSSP